MSFDDVAATSYDRFMGRFSVPLAAAFIDAVPLSQGDDVLDVGCGPGALTRPLAELLGGEHVSGIDPSATFVQAARQRVSGADIHLGSAESLPFADGTFDVTLAQLVVHFMTDAAAGLAEMVRVTRRGGVVAACVWDFEHDRQPHAVFLRAAQDETGAAPSYRPGTRRGDLERLLSAAGCTDIVASELSVRAEYSDFDEWWLAHTQGIGSSAKALDGLDAAGVARVRARSRSAVGDGPIRISATAWSAHGLTA